MTDRILRRPEVERITGLSKSTLYRMIARGDFPAPARIGERAVGWHSRIVIDWLTTAAESRETC
ncbi:helix-turn-helix transcriptional regulator [Roseivivax marinus]|uniref:helix-turn-helix transcriptional regulator n=1 Tax=Roseivivax marinus TaxID=1379903 RepID=UPI00273D06DA|nr:AlpA family phage regulatory protein [Roseivivax marinus]